MANHFEAISDSIILLCRSYPNESDGDKAYISRILFGASCVIAWHPITNCATVKGLRNFDIEREDFTEVMRDIGEDLFDLYEIDVIDWERGSGKNLKKRRIGYRKWIDIK